MILFVVLLSIYSYKLVEGFSKKTEPVLGLPAGPTSPVSTCQMITTILGAIIPILTSDPKYASSGQNCTQYCKVNKPEDSIAPGGVGTCGYKTSTGTLSVEGSKQYCSCTYSDYGNV
jgi:hypothetical protein